ncbi:MAG: endonuclease III [Eubacteriaceae bacterium]|nr:endonuclease III [Eubacteriaceae bacterium]
MDKKKAQQIFNGLKEEYPHAGCPLIHRTPYELLVATVLSAQCTDVRVNAVSSVLFDLASTPSQMIELGEDKLRECIAPCGLMNSKARNIISLSADLVEKHSSQVPKTFEELVALDGVGRKTANVVLYNAFGTDTFAVDTHVFRLCNRLGLAQAKNPMQTETAVTTLMEPGQLGLFHHLLILHGRAICKARKPDCRACVVSGLCEYPLAGQ